MESTKATPRVTRTRGKATLAEDTPAANTDAEMAPNLNGNKDGGVDTENATTVPVKEAEAAKESGRVTRKRKLTEVKTDEEVIKEAKESAVDNKADTKEDSTNNDEAVTPEESNNTNQAEEVPVAMDTIEPSKPAEVITPVVEQPVVESMSNDFISISTGSETYGKGKRARVPNKRYSDIIRPITRTPKSEGASRGSRTHESPGAKNGEFPEDDLGEILREESEFEAKGGLSPVAKKGVKKTKPVSMSNPNYLKPFKYGWKRELVFRTTFTDGCRNRDVYYYNAAGKKFRSMREITDNLHNNRELSQENFTFCKETLGLDDTDKEIVRFAKQGNTTPLQINRKMTSKLIKPKKGSKADSPPAASPTKGKSAKSASFKVKAPVKPAIKKTKKEAEVEAPVWNFNKKKINVDRKPCQPCSIRCDGMQGLVPCLQCRICLCLYHNECVGIAPQVNVQAYVCKKCQLEQEPSDGNSGTSLSTETNLPQPNTPFTPALANTDNTSAPERQNADLSPNSKLKLNNNNTEQKSLVGSLTTWFPQSSTIQVSNNESDSLANIPRRPQLVEYIGNKKYVVVPRHNILSVRSPAQADVASTAIFKQRETNVVSDCPQSPTESSACNPSKAETPDRGECKQEAFTPSTAEDEKPAEPVKTSKPSPRSQEGSVARSGPPNFMNTYMQNLQYGYTTLFGVFQYLKVQDLLRAGCVCTMWRDMSRYPALWRTVRMKNSQIHSFDGMANALRQHGTVHLDLRKMLLPSNATDDDIWPSFTNAIKKVESLRRIELCRCLASVVEDLARNNHNLEVINAVTIKCEGMTFEPFENLTNLVDLRLKSMAGLTLSSDLSALQALTKLKHLSITSIKDLNKLNIEVIADLVNLEVLDLGECTDFPKHFGTDILSKLTKLEKLRLEKGQGDCHTFEILEAVKELPGLQQLELVNFDIKAGFDKTLGACFNIKKLLIIPTYISQSATTNHMVLGGVLRLQKTLSHFVWGVTLELLRVTQLFVSQQSSEQPDKKESNETNSESIPVLKPVPLHGIPQAEAASPSDTPQVEILPLSNLKNLLLQNLPTTRVKIVKIPFHSTWRQSITDSVN
ncbi:uncharacterized protein [Atheta coriaria]|uniref:uncharacterized protein isoform X2 n=1 Tax=Dalotia coriaria TaxID=877792 RepID=UPI0031F46719